MSIDMYLERSQAQAASARQIAEQEIANYEALASVLSDFEASEGDLKGKTYTSARQFSSEILRPLVDGGKQLAQAIAEAVEKFPEAYTAEVAGESLKESELERQIAELNNRINTAKDAVASMKTSKNDKHAQARQTNYQNMISIAEDSKRELEEKLEKLRAFHASSPQLFAQIDALKSAFETGLKQANSSWDSKSGTFKMPKDRGWVQVLNVMKLNSEKLSASLKLTQEEQQYVENLKSQFGFDDVTARQIIQVRRGLDKKFPDKSQEDIDYLLLRILGGTVYSGTQWDVTAGSLKDEFGTTDIVKIMDQLGLSRKEAKQLNYNIRLQHSLAAGETSWTDLTSNEALYNEALKKYKNVYGSTEGFEEFYKQKWNDYSNNGALTHADFAHQSITLATILHNPSKTIQDLAGWRGDATRDAEANPSMANDDYLADLDAVNLAQRMKNGASLFEASNEYYPNAEQLRRDEFIANQGSYTKVQNRVLKSMVPHYSELTEVEAMEYLKQYEPVSYNFLMSLKNGENHLVQYVDPNK